MVNITDTMIIKEHSMHARIVRTVFVVRAPILQGMEEDTSAPRLLERPTTMKIGSRTQLLPSYPDPRPETQTAFTRL